jgi:hypothetical protein
VRRRCKNERTLPLANRNLKRVTPGHIAPVHFAVNRDDAQTGQIYLHATYFFCIVEEMNAGVVSVNGN